MNFVSFPKLGIELNLKETVNFFGLIDVYWYGIIIGIGMVTAIMLAMGEFKRNGYKTDDLLDFVLFALPLGIVGARLYYVIFAWEKFKDADFFKQLYNIVAIWNGGLAIYGGIIVGAVIAVIWAKIKKVPFLWFADIGATGLFIAQSIGRWGNFVNAEAFGGKTDLPWGMIVDGAHIENGPFGPCHPTFLYESLWNLTGFIVAYFIIRRFAKTDGYRFAYYLMWYGVGRYLIEGLREDSLMVNLWIFGEERVSKLVASLCVLMGIAVVFYIKMAKKKSFREK